MNLRRKILSVFATSSIVLGMTAGMAVAQDFDYAEGETQLEVTCAPTTGIELAVGGPFTINTTDGDAGVGSQGGFEFELDLTCNWSTDFEVNAEISDFVHADWENVILTNQAASFDGGRLTLTGGSREYNGVVGLVDIGNGAILSTAGPPAYVSTVFSGDSSYTDNAIEDQSESVTFWGIVINLVDAASPGVTTVSYTGNLDTSGLLLAQGTYEADLTLELIVN